MTLSPSMTLERKINPDTGWTILDDRLIEKTRVFDLRAQRMKSLTSDYEDDFFYVHTGDWVNVLAVTPKQELVLVKQFRHGVNLVSLETPGGIVEGNDDPKDTAARELAEETGYVAPELVHLGSLHPNPAMLTNECHVYLALGAERTQSQDLDPAEQITVHLRPLTEVPSLIRNGTIRHSIVSAALFLLWMERPDLFVSK